VNSAEFFRSAYRNPGFLRIYQSSRNAVYAQLSALVKSLNITQVFDIGCSAGLLVNSLNLEGVDSWGVDFDIPELKQQHSSLAFSNKFLYGDATELNLPICKTGSALLVIDTLRHIEFPIAFGKLGAEYILIKEVSAGVIGRYLRRNEKRDYHLYSPAELLRVFPGYRIESIHSTRFIFTIRKPSRLALACMNQLPTYTAVLRRI
jgi:hypothetical protein